MRAFLLGCLALFPIAHFCHRQTDGFALTKVSTCLLKEASSEVGEVGGQTYRYMGKGGQCYVFISEDGNYVLKLLRSSRLNALQFLHQIFPLEQLEKRIHKQQAAIYSTLNSYALALSKLKEETGLIGAHLDTQPLPNLYFYIVDKIGITHMIDANRYPFIIQKRAVLVKETIEELIQSNRKDEIKAVFTRLFSLLKDRASHGIEDYDPNLTKNFGFCGAEPIQIDAGRFALSERPALDRIASSKEDLQHWINQHYPEIASDFNQAYEEFLYEFQ